MTHSTESRVFARVTQSDEDPIRSCWEWQGYRTPKGYGRITAQRKPVLAHRWVYEHMVGPVPTGLDLDHLCKVRHCVNPSHLEPVTRAVNNARRTPPKVSHAARGQIRAWYSYGFSQSTIGKWFGVSQCHVSHIIKMTPMQYDTEELTA